MNFPIHIGYAYYELYNLMSFLPKTILKLRKNRTQKFSFAFNSSDSNMNGR